MKITATCRNCSHVFLGYTRHCPECGTGVPRPRTDKWLALGALALSALAIARSAPDGPARLERLAMVAQSWRWDQRAEEIFWQVARTSHSPRWVLDSLWTIAASRADTEQLQQVAGFLAKADPRSVTARNNYTFLCLLTRTQEGDPHRTAERQAEPIA